MEFLVHLSIDLPPDTPADVADELRANEARRARELLAEGSLVRIWRDPGRRANWSLYRVRDATALHAAIGSLPLWPWMTAEVHALAEHPAEAAPPTR